jgi:hypothetical protein
MIIKCLNLMPKSSDPVIIVNINAKFIFIISRHKMYNAIVILHCSWDGRRYIMKI